MQNKKYFEEKLHKWEKVTGAKCDPQIQRPSKLNEITNNCKMFL